MRTLVYPLYKRVGYTPLFTKGNKHLDIYMRKLAVAWACRLDHEECKEKATQQFYTWMQSNEPDNEDENQYVNMTSIYKDIILLYLYFMCKY